jgi:uncharacterized tellurite resistance protein B-like protein
MARGRKSGSGGVLGAVVLGAIALLASVPREIWIGAGVLLAVGIVLYLYSASRRVSVATDEAEADRSASAPPSDVPRSAMRSRPATSARFVEDDAPVRMESAPSQSTGFRVPAAPTGFGAAAWIPAGQSVTVNGAVIRGGLLYVGTSLPTPSGENDPCLIDPSKSVASAGDFTERQFGYWPSYSEIPPAARRAYLSWLADGRRNPEADIGYVFLFFYGLERRAIIDAAKDETAQADWPAIAAELRRLIDIYGGKSNSFRRYANDLLDWVSIAELPSKLYEKPVPSFPKTFEMPFYLRLALGQAAVDGVPVPAHLAFAWVRADPNVYLRTPAVRCAEEFERLFAQKYAEFCGPGLVLPRNRTKLKIVYRPASAGFRGYGELKLSCKDTPDITVLTAPSKKLQEVVEAATKPLEPFSRLLGKNAEARTTLEGLLQLPASLWPETAQTALQSLMAKMSDGMTVMPFRDLLGVLGAKSEFTKERTKSLARALESVNIGFEPDVLSGARAPKVEDTVVLFELAAADPVPRTAGPYLAASLTLQLASAVAAADGEFSPQEMDHLRETVLSWGHLSPNQIRRLLAQLRMLVEAPASLTALKKKFEPVEQGAKEAIAAFMAAVVQSDGAASPVEVKMLEKVYRALGVESKKVFSDVHAIAAGVRPPPSTAVKAEAGFRLDAARIAELQKDTERVSALLANIFVEAESAADASPVPEPEEAEPGPDTAVVPKGLMGLDEAHSGLVRMMLSRPEWSREDLMDIVGDLDLMLDGALEHINEVAYDLHGIPMFEGDDPLAVNPAILEKVAP